MEHTIKNIPHPKTIVVVDSEPLPDRESLELIVTAILTRAKETHSATDITNYILAQGFQFNIHNQDAVVALVQKYFVEKLNQSLTDISALDGTTAVAKHLNDMRENRRAYSIRRTNPNAVFWPDKSTEYQPRDIYSELPWAEKFSFIDKDTPIGSAGTCFEMEMAYRLQEAGYNYVITERRASVPGQFGKYASACAGYGIILNVPAMKQLVEKSFGEFKPPRTLWKMQRDGKTLFMDPFREDILFDSVEQYDQEYDTHIAACREALLKCKTFILGLGVNEVWTLKTNGCALSRCPWGFPSGLIDRKVLTVEENVRHLNRLISLWKAHNPEIKIILAVSPAPLHATFHGDTQHVISATCYSKAVLRAAAQEVVEKNKNVFYFPSFEQITYCSKDAWQPDQRHATNEAIDGVMKLFAKMYIKGETIERRAVEKIITTTGETNPIQQLGSQPNKNSVTSILS